MRVLHLAARETWERAQAEGAYTGSTRGADLAAVGFVHCCAAGQLPGVLARHYADAALEGHVLLVLDVAACERAGSPVRWDGPAGGEAFPHVHGPVPLDAVVAELALARGADGAPVLPDLRGLGVV